MTFNQITLKNLRRNVKHYIIFIFSLLISINIYFSFATLKYSHSINSTESGSIVANGAKVGIYILFFIIVIFLLYANHLFIKRRTKEVALYQLIGLTKKDIIRLLSIEQSAIFFFTGILGTLLGFFSSEILLYIVSKLMKINIHISIDFEPQAFSVTIFMLMTSFILITIQNIIFLRKRNILNLMKDAYTSEATQTRITIFEIVSGILGLILLAFSYYMAIEMFGIFQFLTNSFISPFLILFSSILGSYLLFRSSVSLIFKSIKYLKNGRVNIKDVVFASSIMYRMKKNAMSLTVISIASAFTVTMLCFASITNSTASYELESTSPDDFNISQPKNASQFEKQLDKASINYHKLTYEVIRPKIISNQAIIMENNLIDISGAISFMSNKQLKGKEARVTNTKWKNSMIHIDLGKDVTFKGESKETVTIVDRVDNKIYPTDISFNFPIIEVSPEVYNSVKTDEIVDKMYGYNILNHKYFDTSENIAKEINPNIMSRDEQKENINETNGILIFVTSFLGLAFLVAAGCIIYIKQVDEIEDEIKSFRILRRIGFTKLDIFKGMILKVLFNFGLPLIIALLHAFFASYAFMKMIGIITSKPIIIVMIIYTIVYFVFAMITLYRSNKVIENTV